MITRHYELGQVVFAEGDESEFVGCISGGEAEISRRHGDDEVIIGYVTAGEYVGEMAAIEGRPHQATVRATGRLTVDFIDRAEFLEHASKDSALAFRLLERLSQRLHRMDDAYVAAISIHHKSSAMADTRPPEPASPATHGGPALRLLAGSDRVAELIPADGLVLDHLPFVVGRTPMPREDVPAAVVHLLIEDPAPFRLSRLHFAFLKHDGHIQVRDLRSHTGTQVNGTYIGRFFPRDMVALTPGENVIVAGGKNSPYVFKAYLAE